MGLSRLHSCILYSRYFRLIKGDISPPLLQSFDMVLALKTIAGLILACLVVAKAAPVHFPHGKTVVYKYTADVKTGTLEPRHYASQFALEGLLYIRHDSNDSENQNSYYVALTDLEHGMFNGQVDYNEKIRRVHPISDSVRVLQDPFMITYDDNGKLHGVKIPESESDWSRNLKHAIAVSLQLDFSMMNFGSDTKTHRFISEERTIHGMCQVDQAVIPKKEEKNHFLIMKTYEPRQCSEFVQNEYNMIEDIDSRDFEEDMVTSSVKEYEIEKVDEDILIRKFVGYSSIDYVPWMHRSEAQYILTNQTFIFEKMMTTSDMKFPTMNFYQVPLIQNVSYKSPSSNYALHAAPDVTHGRHIVKLDILMPKLKRMLEEAADYLDENHINMTDPEWKHGQTINRLLQTMVQMDPGSLEQVYNVIHGDKTQREITVKNLFLEMLPHVGTTASSLFIRNLIRKNVLSQTSTIGLLNKLPSFIRTSSEKLLSELEEFIKFDENVRPEVRKAGILCFSSLIYKTYKPMFVKMETKVAKNPLILDRYLHDFLDKVKNEPLYEMKIVYLMALRNIRVGNVQRLLMPIIKKEVSFSERPEEIRLTALWSIIYTLPRDSIYIQDNILPILANSKEPLKLRLTSCTVLMASVQNTNDMMNLYWFMVSEKNPHLHHYYYTALKRLANSVSPFKKAVSEMARIILHFVRPRTKKNSLSAFYSMEYNDPKYGHGEAIEANLFMTERIGLPNMGNIMHISSIGRKMFYQHGIHWNTNLFSFVSSVKETPIFGKTLNLNVADEKAKNILLQATEDLRRKNQEFFADIFIFMHGRVIMANHYNRNNKANLMSDLEEMASMKENIPLNWQHIMYHNLYQLHVPTDLGVPAVMGTYIPYTVSLRLNKKEDLNEYIKLEIDPRIWRHGEYKMSVYNPIADVWHSVHRVTTTDVAFPLGILIKTSQAGSSKGVDLNTVLTLSRLPDPKLLVSGVRIYAMNHVSILEDENDLLEKHCDSCKHHEIVTKGMEHRKCFKKIFDCKDTGLRYTSSIFDCENGLTPTGYLKEIYRSLSKENKSHWGSWLAHVFLAITQQISNDISSPEVGTCGKLLMMEPSFIYPSSEVVISLNWNLREIKNLAEAHLYLINGVHNEVFIKADIKGSTSNNLMRSWILVIKHDLTYDYVRNKVAYLLTRSTPGETDLKMELEIEKLYPEVPDDLLKIRMEQEEVNTKVSFNIIRDPYPETKITLNIKGEVSEEQRKKFWLSRNSSAVNVKEESCAKDQQNNIFANPKNLIPRTWNCIHDAMIFTEMRKYTVEANWREVPSDMAWALSTTMDYVWTFQSPRIRHEWCPEDTYMKLSFLFPMDKDTVDIDVFRSNNCSDFSVPEIPIGTELSTLLRDTTHIYLTPLYSDMLLPICTIYPKILLSNEDSKVPLVLPPKWTLLTGDGVHLSYAIFVKTLPDNTLDMMMVVENQKLELLSRNNKVVVRIDGNIIENPNQVFIDGPFNFISRIVERNDGLVILQSSKAGFLWLEYALTSVSIIGVRQHFDVGLCGYVHDENMKTGPKLYTL